MGEEGLCLLDGGGVLKLTGETLFVLELVVLEFLDLCIDGTDFFFGFFDGIEFGFVGVLDALALSGEVGVG